MACNLAKIGIKRNGSPRSEKRHILMKMQKFASRDSDTALAVWWLGTALAGLIAMLALEHALTGAPWFF